MMCAYLLKPESEQHGWLYRMSERGFDGLLYAYEAGLKIVLRHRFTTLMVMLGNQVELWETMLGVIKLGAVVMPTTAAIGPADLVDRLDRGAAKAVICNVVDAANHARCGDQLIA